MRKSKTCLILFLLGFALISTVLDVRGAGSYGSLEVGEEWTMSYRDSASATAKNVSLRVTHISGAIITGDTSDASLMSTDFSLMVWTQTFLTGTVAVLATIEWVVYGGVNLTAYVTTTLTGYDSIVVANDTGIVLNITETGGARGEIVSWTYTAALIPGYEVGILVVILGVSILGIIVYMKKIKVLNAI